MGKNNLKHNGQYNRQHSGLTVHSSPIIFQCSSQCLTWGDKKYHVILLKNFLAGNSLSFLVIIYTFLRLDLTFVKLCCKQYIVSSKYTECLPPEIS